MLDHDAPVEFDAVPAEQLTHAVDPLAVWYAPAMQFTQIDAPAAENDPGPHVRQADAPLDANPTLCKAEYMPAEQLVHMLAPAPEYWPAAQLEQLDDNDAPVDARKKVPAMQLLHADDPVTEE